METIFVGNVGERNLQSVVMRGTIPSRPDLESDDLRI